MLKICEIEEQDFRQFIETQQMNNIYQSIEWVSSKNSKYEILGLFNKDMLIGASIVTYIKILKMYYVAYCSRGFVFNYEKIPEFTKALKTYFAAKKNVVFFRMDPLIKLAIYDVNLEKESFNDAHEMVDELIHAGFKHYGYNYDYSTWQFRFTNGIELKESYDDYYTHLGKSTRKNIEKAISLGVKVKRVGVEQLKDVVYLFDESAKVKKINSLNLSFYQKLASNFKNESYIYMAYIDKKDCLLNLKNKLGSLHTELEDLKKQQKKNSHSIKIDDKLQKIEKNIIKNEELLKTVEGYSDIVYIGSLFGIHHGNEAIALSSGMNYKYRDFCPKYAMYPALIKDAINQRKSFVNFLGVKNIFDKNDSAYGVYEIKKCFGGKTTEFIGEFDLPFKKTLYKIYKIKENKDRALNNK